MPNTLIIQFNDLPNTLETRVRLIEMLTGISGSGVDKENNRMAIDITNVTPDKIDSIRRQIEAWGAEITVQ